MAYETKNNTGSLFKNDKQGNDRRPDYTGICLIDDKEFRMSAWIKVSKNGMKYMSMSFQPNESKPASFDLPENDVPF